MKKVFASLAIVALAFCFVSCKKSCTCVTTENGETVQTVSVEGANCASMNVTQTMDDVVVKTECN